MMDFVMPDTLLNAAASIARDTAIVSIGTVIVDVPTIRRHKLSNTAVSEQNYVIVRLRLANGVEGIGEAATLGGPRWAEESVEAIKANIDFYLAPRLLGSRADLFVSAGKTMALAAKRNYAAKAAIETAMFDAVGKTLGLPVSALLGGAVRSSVKVLWTLASGDPAQEIEEAEQKLAARLHDTFKVKIGAQAPQQDMARLKLLSRALLDRAELIVDVNQAWDETAARRFLPQLREIGISLVEQPLAAWNIGGLARLRATAGGPPLLADECIFSPHDMMAAAQANAADAVSLKLVKHGGLLALKEVAAIAAAGGIGLYGGCLLESSVGAAAHLQAFATLPTLDWGCEHFGPQILVDDLVTTPLRYENFEVLLPDGPGLGVVLDEDKLKHFARS
jgi:muconate cycloisomerase